RFGNLGGLGSGAAGHRFSRFSSFFRQEPDRRLRGAVRRRRDHRPAGSRCGYAMTSPLLPPPSRQDVRRGILYMVAAVFVFASVNALVKWEVQTYPVTEVVFFRCLFALVPCSL